MTVRRATVTSFLFLLASNLAVIWFAVNEQWDLGTIIWVYWFQSVCIGIFQMVKIADIERFTTDGFKINGRPVDAVPETKWKVIPFFAVHYGFFHLGFFAFLPKLGMDWYAVAPAAGLFFVNHLTSWLTNRAVDRTHVRNIGTMMFFPYIRILPMYAVLGLATSADPEMLVRFLLLKTGADLVMHLVEHSA